MKRQLIAAMLLLGLLPATSAQENNVALAQIKYEFIHIDDTMQRDKPYNEDMLLLLGHSSSVYKSYTAIKAQENLKRQLEDQKGSSDITINMDLGGKNRSSTVYHNRPQDKKFYKTDRIATTEYLMEEKHPSLSWQITEESKDIGDYTCQKATTSYAGRNYTAWFTTELPFPFGPWKLSGLPGLILEAEDDKNEVQFKYLEFATLEGEQKEPIAIAEKAIKTNEKAFNKALDAFRKDPSAAFNAASGNRVQGRGAFITTAGTTTALPSSNTVSSIRVDSGGSGASQKKKTKNNPLELNINSK